MPPLPADNVFATPLAKSTLLNDSAPPPALGVRYVYGPPETIEGAPLLLNTTAAFVVLVTLVITAAFAAVTTNALPINAAAFVPPLEIGNIPEKSFILTLPHVGTPPLTTSMFPLLPMGSLVSADIAPPLPA